MLAEDPIAEARRQWQARGWSSAATGMAAVTSLMRAQAIVQARVDDVLKPLGLTFARYELLALLAFTRHGSMSMAHAGALLQVHPASVTNAASRLEAAELLTRRRHPEDRRGVVMAITDTGRKVMTEATGHLNETVFVSLGLTEDKLESLVDLIRDLRHVAGDFD